MKKILALVSISSLVVIAQADTIRLTSGKSITGQIQKYTSGEGIQIETEDGQMTVKISQVESFKISGERGSSNQPASYESSQLYKLGLRADLNKISGMDFQYDVDVGQISGALLYGVDNTLGIGLLITMEPMDITNDEYFKTIDALQKANFEEFSDTPKRSNKVGPFLVLQKTYDATVSDMDFTYKLMTFKVGSNNYRILYWALQPVFERADDKVVKFLNGFSIVSGRRN